MGRTERGKGHMLMGGTTRGNSIRECVHAGRCRSTTRHWRSNNTLSRWFKMAVQNVWNGAHTKWPQRANETGKPHNACPLWHAASGLELKHPIPQCYLEASPTDFQELTFSRRYVSIFLSLETEENHTVFIGSWGNVAWTSLWRPRP